MGGNDWDEPEWFGHDWLHGLPDWRLWELEMYRDRHRMTEGYPAD